jgi:hypothetical protein
MEQVTSADLQHFLDEVVNLRREDVAAYREQVRHLQERLTLYVAEHPDFVLQKMLRYGSLAKGTALSTLSEIDVAVYLRQEGSSTKDLRAILDEVRDLLLQVYPQMKPSQVTVDPPAVTVRFEGSGLSVDVVPVLPNGKPGDRGLLVLRAGGEWVETSIPLQLEFIRARAQAEPQFRPLIRLTKWWAQECNVPISSFILELLWAHRFGARQVPEDLQEALLEFFGYIVRSNLAERIIFTDNYPARQVPAFGHPVQIADPVNPANNVAAAVTDQERRRIVELAHRGLEAVALASLATSRGRGTECYQRVFGTRFPG